MLLVIWLVAVSVGGAAIAVLYDQRRTLLGQAITDPLTGAFNRRHLDCCLTSAIVRQHRTGEPVSLLMFDVDHFKRINDTLGHAAGDAALKALVALVSARARKLDVLFRIGGEEFILLLPATTRSGAVAVAEEVRALVVGAAVVDGGRLSISVGVSELQKGQSASDWIRDADAALYRAKQDGRNRVTTSGGMMLTEVRRQARC
jgi:diguanylate cyclase (GGDEF)-like protein